MNILVDNGSPLLRNIGDMAMLQGAVQRLRRLWPEATIHVMSGARERLGEFIPGTQSVPVAGRTLFCREGTYLASAGSRGGGWLTERLRRRWPIAAHRYMSGRLQRQGQSTADLDAFVGTLARCDLIVAAGGGYINDSFTWVAYDILEALRIGLRLGIPVAVMGQGLGPLTTASIRNLASSVLGQAMVVGLREKLTGPPLAKELRVDPARIVVTGDDAMEMLDGCAPPPMAGRTDIGVNIRVVDYAGVDAALASALRPAFAEAAGRLGARLTPLPVAAHNFDDDAAAIASIIGASPATPNGAEPIETLPQFLRRLASCRIVVTGSYHAGVFALATGIPVVALANNAYYMAKFEGLADMFGTGCEMVRLDQPEPARLLDLAIGRAWEMAETVGPSLRESTDRQLRAGRQAYDRIAQALDGRRAGAGA